MNYLEKSSQQVNRVYKTNDLTIFKEIKGNRPPNPQHVRRLTDSIKTNGLLCNPILVNEKHEVIDGQHRLLAAKESKSGIYYVILKGYNLKEVHALNLNQKNWSKKDFMDGYADMGIEPYYKLKDFSKKNKQFNFGSCIAMCSNKASYKSYSISQKYRADNNITSKLKQVFEEGTWLGGDFDLAQENADKIKMIKPYYAGYNRTTFVSVLLGLLPSDNFDFFEFLSKLKIQQTKMQDCSNVEQYKLLIEDIYNYRRRDKVNLRY